MEYTEQQKAEFRSEFEKRRKRQIILAVPLVGAMVSLVVLGEGESQEVRAWVVGIGVLILAAVVFSLYNWRCPACNKYLGKGMNPSFCSKCGAPLR